jgi:hypothetical protein
MGHAVIKLMNGEEIVAEVFNEDNDTIKLCEPVQIHRVITPNGYEMIKCSHWLLFSNKPEILLEKKHILLMVNDINEKVLTHYNFFIKHAKNKGLEHHGDFVERAEQIYKEQQLQRQEMIEDGDMEQADLNFEVLLRNTANTTIH